MTEITAKKKILRIKPEEIKLILQQGYDNNIVYRLYQHDPVIAERFLDALRNHHGDEPLDMEFV